MQDKFVQRLWWSLFVALGSGMAAGMLTAWWLGLSGLKGWLPVLAATQSAGLVFALFTPSLTEPLQRLTEILRRGEEPSTLLLQELGALGEALAVAWQRWQKAMGELQEEQALLQAVLERMTEAVLVADEHGHILLANAAAERFFPLQGGYLHRRLTELHLPFALLELAQKALRTGTPQWGEVQTLHPEERFLYAYAVPLTKDEKRMGVLLVARDLTELKRLERIRRDFVANVSHELRTPISTFRSLVEALLIGGADDPQVRDRFLQALVEEAERMGRLVDNLLELARVEAGQRKWRWQTVSVSQVAREVAARLRPQAAAKGLTVTVHVPDSLTVQADPDALTQILFNLLDNAIKYTQQGEVSVTAERVAASEGEWVVIHVRDTGIGIPPEHLPRIFERFYRVDKARSRQVGGFGLGLSIVKHLVEAHKGKITVQSRAGEGSTFSVWLPVAM
ncbi:MAG: hypothetical protein IMHGJWDQ_001718 [Candidatus Fervidibacter sp.]